MSFLFWLTIIALILLIPTAYAAFIGAPYAPTRSRAIRQAFKQINLSDHDFLVDLGAGDGKVVQLAAAQGAKALGYELSPIMWAVAKVKLFFQKSQATIKFRDFYQTDLPSGTTVIFAFLMPENMPRLKKYLSRQQIPQGKYLLSYMFHFKDIEPIQLIHTQRDGQIFVYDLQNLIASS
jgi:cyclopropane fatty-acyl-phospholipid synthase-like methyltransferase